MLSRHLERILYTQSCRTSVNFKYCTKTMDKQITDKNETTATARPFNEIPAPSKFEMLRGFLPGGAFYQKPADTMIKHFAEKFGAVFRLPGLFGNGDIIFSLNPDDYAIVFRNEGKWPHRRAFDSLVYYREVYRHDFFQGIEGIVSTSGEKWAKIRTAINPILLQPKNAKLYFNTILEVNNEFLQRVREIRDPTTLEMPDTFEDEINRLTLESVCAVALNTKLGLIRENRESAEARTLISGLRRIFDLAFELDIMPSLWKYIRTPKFNEMMKTLDDMTNICNKYITAAFEKIEREHNSNLVVEEGMEKSVLEKLLRIDQKTAVVMALDMMMAGVDTTSSALTGILLCIAKNPEKQEKLFEELLEILPEKDSPLTLDNMRNLPYLRACIKEGLRMYTVIPGTMRTLPVDVVLSGYHVPAGAEINVASSLLLYNEKYVPRPKEFLPERWIRGDPNIEVNGIKHPYVYLPFGFGRRQCAGIRIVDMELEMTIAHLVRNFKLEFNYSVENAFKAKLINVPAIPLKFKLMDREA